MRKTVALLFVSLSLSCGPPSTPVEAPDSHPPPREIALSPDDYPAGSCGGFSSLGESELLPLLANRIRVSAPGGTEDSPRPYDIMGAPHAAEMESRLFLEHEGERFVIFAEELFRRPTDDLVAAARRDLSEGHGPEEYSVAALRVRSDMRAAVAVPRELDLSDEAVSVAVAYTVTADSLVQRVGFYVTPGAARSGGCRRLGLELAQTLTPGPRQLGERPGPQVLEGTYGIDLPEDHRLVVQEGPDFTVYRVYPVLPLGGGEGSLGFYLGYHASFGPPEEATRTPGELLGQPMEWLDWTRDDVRIEQALVRLGGDAQAHIFLAASEPETFAALGRIARSFRDGVAAPPLPACSPTARLPAFEADAELLAIAALRALLEAAELSVYRQTWDVPRVEPALHFVELMGHPRARDAFLYLSLHGTTAGRIYGLAGLSLHDPETFDEVVCAVRGSLDEQVSYRMACGTELRAVATLVEHPDGVRGQRHWSSRMWATALSDGAADLRGGGLGWRLALGAQGGGIIRRDAWTISGAGYEPPLSADDRLAASLPPFAPAASHPRITAFTQNGGVCRTRRDGRLACWGTTPISERRGPTLLPVSARWPSAVAVDLGVGCMLDASGRRTCFGLLENALAARASACSGAPTPTEPVVRRFDDGPWRALTVGGDVCGIRDDGSLHCFVSSNQYNPEWAELSDTGVGASYPVPIDGEVRGTGEGYLFNAYAWTTDGRIFAWTHRDRPAEVGRIEGVIEVMGGNDTEIAFARTSDGRVFVRGARPDEYWESFGDAEGPWREIEALRGHRIYLGDHHACTLAPDHTVRCWGQRTGFLPGTEGSHYDEPPMVVETLRGARDLILGEWLTCAELANGQHRCVGSHLDSVSNGAVDEETRAPMEVNLSRIAESIE